MEEDLCLRTTAGVYEQEERPLLNILSSLGSLRTERLHFRSVPPQEPVDFEVRTASTPPAVVPSCRGPRNRDPREEKGGEGRGSLTSQPIHQPVTVESL